MVNKGIVIYSQNYRENDLLLHVLFENDIKTIFAKGALKLQSKNASALQLYACSNFEVLDETKTNLTLKTATLINGYPYLRNDLLTSVAAQYMCEAIDRSKIVAFDLLQTCLNYLNKDIYSSLCLFQSILNRLLGIEAYVDGCVLCNGLSNITLLSLKHGGFVCGNCLNQVSSIKQQDLYLFRLYSKAKLNNIDLLIEKYQANFNILKLFIDYCHEYSGLYVKSSDFLLQILQE